MKTLPMLLLATLPVSAELDLTRLEEYANQPRPAYITRDNTTAGNPITNLGATLGRVMFYDKRLSRNETVSCASCHRQERAFSDTATASVGVAGTTGRHSMRLINSRFANERRFFWDERAATLEAQTTQPVRDHTEMGFSGTLGDPGFADLVTRLTAVEEYKVLFTAVYGDPAITETRIQRALAQFVRSIQSFDSKYDVGRSQVGDGQPFPNFTASENNGKALFLNPPGAGGAGCAGCHAPPEFDIDPNSGNNGVVGVIGGGTDFTVTRSPTLRDLVGPGGQSNGGMMHTAQFATLAQVIAHYNAIPAVVQGIDPRLTRPGPGGPQPQRLNLTTNQQNDIAAFLRTLTGSSVYTAAKWSSPFDPSGALGLIVLPSEGVRMTPHSDPGGPMMRVSMTAVPNVTYVFQSSVNLSDWDETPVTAAANGTVEVLVPVDPAEGQAYYRFAYLAGGL
ncbi:MAG: hypothetical protein MUF31_07075 [Akkermansiaceae bacterium]|jgi:cytochrome c peroxidase|nr:hypothetical protein [Akkermansiaceae bacterium]